MKCKYVTLRVMVDVTVRMPTDESLVTLRDDIDIEADIYDSTLKVTNTHIADTNIHDVIWYALEPSDVVCENCHIATPGKLVREEEGGVTREYWLATCPQCKGESEKEVEKGLSGPIHLEGDQSDG